MYKLLYELYDPVQLFDWKCLTGVVELGSIHSIVWHPKKSQLLTTHGNCVVRIWNIGRDKGELVHRLPHNKFVLCAAWHPNGNTVATGDTQADPVRIWNVEDGELLHENWEHYTWPISLDWNIDGAKFASGDMDGCVLIWSSLTWDVVQRFKIDSEPNTSENIVTLKFTRDNSKLLFSGSGGKLYTWQNQLQVLNPINEPHRYFGNRFVFCKPQPDNFAFLHGDGTVAIWSVEHQRIIAEMPNHEPMPSYGRHRCIDWSPDGHEIAIVGADSDIRLWNKGVVQPLVKTQDEILNTVSWNFDGTLLATGGEDEILRIWTKS